MVCVTYPPSLQTLNLKPLAWLKLTHAKGTYWSLVTSDTRAKIEQPSTTIIL